MNMIKTFLSVVILVLLISSCNNNEEQRENQNCSCEKNVPPPPMLIETIGNKWLGTWKTAIKGRKIYEVWQRINDTVYAGRSFEVKGNDTIVQETMELRDIRYEIYYILTVKGQNQNKAISFKLTDLGHGPGTFENPEHDFPKVIRYKIISADSLVVFISGKMNGKDDTIYFPMKKVK